MSNSFFKHIFIGILHFLPLKKLNNLTSLVTFLNRESDPFSPNYWGYHWSDGEPGTDDCVVLNVTSGSLQTRSCDDILPFICDDAGKDISTIYKS